MRKELLADKQFMKQYEAVEEARRLRDMQWGIYSAVDERVSKLSKKEARLYSRIERRLVSLAVKYKRFPNEHDAVVAFRKNTPKWREAFAAMVAEGLIPEPKTK
ncbi:MAG: hypothetical protein WAN14_16560 [Candidatus Acidiferrales bacterium]